MKKLLLAASFFSAMFISNMLYSQGYFVAPAGIYVSSSNFKTNVQSDLSKYEGQYIAASETYESNYQFLIVKESDALKITMISGATMDGGENWMMDTLVFRNVTVTKGKFVLTDIPANFGNPNFRFVNAEYKQDGKSVMSDGLVMEEYLMFALKQ